MLCWKKPTIWLELLLMNLKLFPPLMFVLLISLCAWASSYIQPIILNISHVVHSSVPPPGYWKLPTFHARLLQWSLIGFPTPHTLFYPLPVLQSDDSFQNSNLMWPILFQTFQWFCHTLKIKTKFLNKGSDRSSTYSLSSFIKCSIPYCSIFQPHWPLFISMFPPT